MVGVLCICKVGKLVVSEVSETLRFDACFSNLLYKDYTFLPSPCVGTSVNSVEYVAFDKLWIFIL